MINGIEKRKKQSFATQIWIDFNLIKFIYLFIYFEFLNCGGVEE